MISDLFAVSRLAMLEALIPGQRDQTVIAHQARARMRAKIDALGGTDRALSMATTRFLLRVMLDRIDARIAHIDQVTGRILG